MIQINARIDEKLMILVIRFFHILDANTGFFDDSSDEYLPRVGRSKQANS